MKNLRFQFEFQLQLFGLKHKIGYIMEHLRFQFQFQLQLFGLKHKIGYIIFIITSSFDRCTKYLKYLTLGISDRNIYRSF